ncbi:MAG: hypothetical protein M3N33_00415 [Actinomycetota bacterium]|nr:hypothetical protein [Actinomycetota bacterium]
MSEEQPKAPRREASDPERAPAPGDEVEPGTQGAGETVCDVCGGTGRLDEGGESCHNCNGTGVVIKAVGGGG